MQGKYNKCISCGNNRVDKMASVPLAGVSNEDVYSAELGAFDYYYNKMKLYVNPATMQGTLLREGLVDGSVISGGAAVFLPDHVKMEELLSQVRQSIALNGPPNLGKLIRALRGVTTYQSLASDINKKYMELLDKARSEARVDKNTAKDTKEPMSKVRTVPQISPDDHNMLLSPTRTTESSAVVPSASRISISNPSILDKPVSMGVIVVIAPKVATRWDDIGYRLRLEEHDVDLIQTQTRGDAAVACKMMLRKWMGSASGRGPKTWRTFVEVLLELDIDCANVIAVLEKDAAQP